jgi:lipase
MRLNVHEWGDPSSPPIVCLHGVTGHGRRFRRLAEERLAARHRVIAPDLRGHGRSEWEPPWRIETYVDDVLEMLDELGVERAVLLGHSFGGRVVLDLAAREPERVERAVLLDPAIQLLAHVAYDNAEDMREERVYDTIDEAVDERLAGSPESPREAVEEDMREHLVEGPDGKLRPRFSQACVSYLYADMVTAPPAPATLRAPTLLLYAPAFGLVREEQVEAYESALGDRLTTVQVRGGHMVYWDAFEETAAAIDEFLAAEPREAATR